MKLAARERVTLATTLVASVAALLHRYTGEEQVCLGLSGVADRDGQAGATLEPRGRDLVLCADVAGQPSVGELLQRTRKGIEAGLGCELADGPDAEPTRDPHDHFRAMIRFGVRGPLQPSSQRRDPTDMSGRPAGVDLCLEVEERVTRSGVAGVAGRILYDTELFESRTIERLTEHLQVLLESMVAEHGRPVGDLRLFTTGQRQQLLAGWGLGAQPPPGPDVVDLITERAGGLPDAVAVQCEGEHYTYGQLEARANRMARLLRDRGVGPDVIVGVCLERSTDHVVALLAVLKAGGAFVILDPEAPRERTRYVLRDSASPLVLTHESLRSRIAGLDTMVLCFDDAEEEARQRSASPLDEAPLPEQPAYLSYTSGSTGKPKGVLVERGPFSAHCRAMAATYGLGRSDRVLQFSQFSADASLEQIFPTLASGARLVMRGGEIWTPEELREQLILRRVTVVNLWPTYWQQAVRVWARAPAALAGLRLRLVILGGERLSSQVLAQWRSLQVETRLLNAYGPTEGIITATLSDAGQEQGLVTIGRPLPGRTVYVLDQAGQAVPVGAVGELYVGGELLARGYLNRPELTDERFVSNPFDPGGKGRLYRTGDRVRFLDDGRIVYLGRVDDQVKVRGYRIELGEVEAVTAEHPSVEEAVVVARGDGENQELVAYVVASGTEPIDELDLRRHLESKLPRAMQPAVIAQLATMPRLATGKPDRRGLPEVARTHRSDSSGYVPPQLLVHEYLVRIWEDLLEARPIGIRDNFFHLGGHSLLAAQLVQRVEQTLGKRPTLSTLFANPTIEQLAASLEEDADSGAKARVLPVQRGEIARRSFSCTGTGPAPGSTASIWHAPVGTISPSSFSSRTSSTLRPGCLGSKPSRGRTSRRCARCERTARTGSAAFATGECWPTKWPVSSRRSVSGSSSWGWSIPRRRSSEASCGWLVTRCPSAARTARDDGLSSICRPVMRCATCTASPGPMAGGWRTSALCSRSSLGSHGCSHRPERSSGITWVSSAGPWPPTGPLSSAGGSASSGQRRSRRSPAPGSPSFGKSPPPPSSSTRCRVTTWPRSPSACLCWRNPSPTAWTASPRRVKRRRSDGATSGSPTCTRRTSRRCSGSNDARSRGIRGQRRPRRDVGRVRRSAATLASPARSNDCSSWGGSPRPFAAFAWPAWSCWGGPPVCATSSPSPGRSWSATPACALGPTPKGPAGCGPRSRCSRSSDSIEVGGSAAALLAELISVARSAGYGELTLHVRRDNGGARRLYERTGFKEARVVSRYYQPSGADALVMTLDISRGTAVP